MASQTSRITIEDLWIIVLGVMFRQWESLCSDTTRLCNLVIQMSDLVNQPEVSIQWLKYLEGAARKLINPEGLYGSQSRKLLKLGMRWCSALLNEPGNNPPTLFGLQDFPKLLGFINDNEERIRVLREISLSLNAHPQDLLIRYIDRPKVLSKRYRPNSEDISAWDEHTVWYGHVLATALAPRSYPNDLSFNSKGPPAKRQCHEVFGTHSRWIISQPPQDDSYFENSCCDHFGLAFKETTCDGNSCACHLSGGTECACARAGVPCTLSCHMNRDELILCKSSGLAMNTAAKAVDECKGDSTGNMCSWCDLARRWKDIEELGERCAIVQPDEMIDADKWSFELEPPTTDKPAYRMLLGDTTKAAIFSTKADSTRGGRLMTAHGLLPSMSDFEKVFSSPLLDAPALKSHLGSWSKTQNMRACNQLQCSLEALTFATKLYKTLPGATISVEVAEKPLYEASWARWIEENMQNSLHKSDSSGSLLDASFACLAMLETGDFDIDPKILQGVLAMSHGDSIFVRSDLISDPDISKDCLTIHRVLGNFGRPETAFLIPPLKPRLEGHDITLWRMIEHEPFDGKFENNFRGTSLHLSFTDFSLPVDVGSRGLRDTLVILLESVVSANDRGNHIGDLDINAIQQYMKSSSCYLETECNHDTNMSESAGDDHHRQLTSIDSWPEFFDLPETTGIFRAHGNWQARLAAAAASAQMGYKFALLPQEPPCAECLGKLDISSFDLIIA